MNENTPKKPTTAELILQRLDEIKNATLLAGKDTLTIQECALLTGLSVSTLYTKTCNKEIPHFKRGKYTYFDKKTIERWLRAHPVASDEEVETAAATHAALRPWKPARRLDYTRN
jgi:excisionase family DNA binding protein